ncbi:MAG TPA: DUF262 domain-containing protein [Bacilli bacterium]|nr:DUF262 domain-containing protein [Bacilli bacterium]
MANNQLSTLNEIFNNKLFRIPDYQRGYAWGENQLEDFWDDILNIKDGGKHYTGLLTVEQVHKEDIINNEQWQEDLWLLEQGYKAYYIIDGQQRLTTSIILLNVILDKFEDGEDINYTDKEKWQETFLYRRYKDKFESYIFGYERDNPSNEYFKTYILGQKSLQADKFPTETLYTSNLKYAKEFFEEKLKRSSKEELEIIFNKVTNGLKFNFYEIDDELDVYITFETMNNRGKPLSKLELLKNRLIYLSTLLEEDDNVKSKLRKDINEVWKTVYEYLGKNVDNVLDDDFFLYNHWIMYFGYNRKQSNAYSNFLLNEYFISKRVLSKNKDGKIGYNEINNYIDSLSKSVKIWHYMHNPQDLNKDDEIIEWFNKLNRLGWGAFEPLILACIVKGIDDENLKELLNNSERFIFLVFRISRRLAYTQNSNFFRMANQVYFDYKTVDDVIKDIDNLIYSENEGWYDLSRFVDYIEDQFKRESGYYSWNGLKYFLYEYEMYLQDKNKESIKVSWETVKKQNSVEHIYPQEASLKCWINAFDKFSERERYRLLHSLGNLLLLSQAKNSKLQNKCFDSKKQKYKFGSHSEIEVSQRNTWTPNEILERGIELLVFMEIRWDIKIENKKEILGLSFMEE